MPVYSFKRPAFTFMKDKKIVIYKRVDININGSMKKTWVPLVNQWLWACYQSLSTDKVIEASTTMFPATCQFYVNWRNDILPGYQVLYNGYIYEIVGVDLMEGYKRDIKLTCKAGLVRDMANYPDVT